jgi:S-formylglutathione hydrolase FrmB
MCCETRKEVTMKKRCLSVTLVLLGSLAISMSGQVKTEVPDVEPNAKPYTVEHIKIHGEALEGNLEGDAVDRDAIVFLPPSYAKEKKRRYPVIYALHGYSIGAEQWTHEIHVPQTIEGAVAKGAKEMIVVLPDSKTIHNGSMYSSSMTTGNFEKYIYKDVVEYMDAHYRTIPNRESRGLVGHSMGGYGASRIGMKHPDVFGALYIMSPCCMSARIGGGGGRPAGAGAPGAPGAAAAGAPGTAAGAAPGAGAPASARPAGGPGGMGPGALEAAIAAAKTPEDVAKLPAMFQTQLASAAAWSPDPKNPPLYADLPTKDGVPQPDVQAKWAANAPLAFVDQYIDNLREYKAISMDVGDQDGLRFDAMKLHEILDSYGIKNGFEIYHGTHTSAVAVRFQEHVMPFFSENLCFEAHCAK